MCGSTIVYWQPAAFMHHGSPARGSHGSLLFAAGIHNVISKVAAEYPGAWCIWYLDDGTVIGDLNTLNAVAARLNQELNGAGLTMNIGKCHVT